MKTILFVMKYPLERPYSIKQKLDGEMKAVEKLGYDVYYISYDKNYYYLNHNDSKIIIKKIHLGKNTELYHHLFAYYDLYLCANALCREYSFDYVYFRYSPLNYWGYLFLKNASKESSIIVEIPTFPLGREQQKSRIRRIYMKISDIWWNKSAQYLNLFTLIGEKADSYLGVPAINIDNGILVDSLPLRNHSQHESDTIHLIAVASMSKWHGYERLIQGLANWDNPKSKNYVIDFIGDEGDGSLSWWKQLVHDYHLDDQVLFHGSLTGDQLNHYFDVASLGISSLGLYKNDFYTGSVLKLREYMARGLPFVFAHNDPDISPEMRWCLKIPNNDSPVDMETVDAFITSIKNDNNISFEMRQHAQDNMTWEKQFSKVFDRISYNDY